MHPFHIEHILEYLPDQGLAGALHLGFIDPGELHVELGEFELAIGAA